MKRFSLFAAGAVLVLAVIFAAPAIERTKVKTNEHNTVVFAQVFRSAIGKCAAANQGRLPARPDAPQLQKILLDQMGKSVLGGNGLPMIHLRHLGHAESSEVESFPFLDAKGEVDSTLLRDTGHWLYDAKRGELLIDCTHSPRVATYLQAPFYRN